jgi:hypothetical protein
MLMVQTLRRPAEPQVINAQEERPLAEWQQLYPDLWLLVEVTEEDEWEPVKGRLIAVDSDDMNLVPVRQEYGRQGKITAMIHGVYTEPGPTVVA